MSRVSYDVVHFLGVKVEEDVSSDSIIVQTEVMKEDKDLIVARVGQYCDI